jgi:hypothetical protein
MMKGATHLLCICSLAVATIARWWKCSHSKGATQLLGFWAICMAETAMPLLFMNSYHSKGATHLLCICSLAVATIARWWKCSHSEGAPTFWDFGRFALSFERCHPPFVYLLACGSHHRQMVEVQSFRRCHPPFGISGDLHRRDGHATWGVDVAGI